MEIRFDESINDYVCFAGEMLHVTTVVPKDNYVLLLTFSTGEKKAYDFRPMLNKPVYKALNNIALFKVAHIECGTVVWNDDIDIAPEWLYEKGVPVEDVPNA
jgi:hypothetical protein